MTNLSNRNQIKLESLAEIQANIEMLKEQIDLLNKRFVEETKYANAQANITKEWKEAITPLKEILKSACGVYRDEEVLEDMMSDIEQIVEEVRGNFEQNKTSPNRYLDEVKEVPTPKIQMNQPLLIDVNSDYKEETLPPKDDNYTLLSFGQIKEILKIHELDITLIKKLAIMLDFEIPRSVKTFAEQGENLLTRAILEEHIQMVKPRQQFLKAV